MKSAQPRTADTVQKVSYDATQDAKQYMTTLTITASLILSESQRLTHLGEATEPAGWGYALNAFHALTTWSLFYTVIGSILSFYYALGDSVTSMDVWSPSLFFFVGVFSFFVESMIVNVPFFFKYFVIYYAEDAVANYLSYAVVHYFFVLNAPVYCYYLRDYSKRHMMQQKQ
mgnify:CR=1 FL=1|tara:strand:- start:451 stop:966 length:516 start_codon:yes stop_codon:yes gene_type:complete